MAKRSATTELNHDNWDQEGESEEAGTFVPASKSTIQNRVIRKAKRSLNKDPAQQGTSPFSAFAGFSSNNSSTPFSFLSKNIDEATKSSLSTEPKKFSLASKNGDSSSTEPQEANQKPVSHVETAVDEKPDSNMEYFRVLQSLNESVLKWIQLHLAKNPCCDFTPVFNDYKKHMHLLNVKYPRQRPETASTATAVSLGLHKKTTEGAAKESENHVEAYKSQKKNADDTDYGAHFPSNTTNTSTFSFGIRPSNPAATSSSTAGGLNCSSKEEEAPKDNSSGFSFGFFSQNKTAPSTEKPFSFAVAPTSNTESTEDAEYVPPKNEFVAVTEEDAIYSKRCKLFFKKGDAYAEKGVGTLYLKSLEDKTQLLIRADTSLGNILLNIMLSASLPMSRTGKNNVLMACVPNPPVDAKNPDSKEPIPILIRVKTAEDADELLETLNKHKY